VVDKCGEIGDEQRVIREGVIQFAAVHTTGTLDPRLQDEARTLIGWRNLLFALGIIGEDPLRYDGVGFGNASVRVPPFRGPRGQESAFLITATQTGKKPRLDTGDLALVESWDLKKNRVVSRGTALPSSESMTHGAVYDVVAGARAVLHVHAPALFTKARALALPTTPAHVGYGTPAMAHEVARLWREDQLQQTRVFAMGGHEDGIVAFGNDVDDAGARLLAVLARALA